MSEHGPQGVRRLTDVEFFAVAVETVGMSRLLQLMGWVVFWNATGQGKPAETRRKLQKAGLSRAAAYRALDDLKEIGARVREAEGRRDAGEAWWEVVPRLKEMSL